VCVILALVPRADDHVAEVYAELRRLARGYLRAMPNGATLQPTALVHEAYLSLTRQSQDTFENRLHFLGMAALAMRQILVQHYRRSNTWKRGAGSVRIPLTDDLAADDAQAENLDELDRALTKLEGEAPELSQLVELRFFGGLTIEETAEFLSLSTPTVKRRWAIARAWLYRELRTGSQPGQTE
jgi:RNA polymerase sigma-70 factor (ECF subfamily)